MPALERFAEEAARRPMKLDLDQLIGDLGGDLSILGSLSDAQKMEVVRLVTDHHSRHPLEHLESGSKFSDGDGAASVDGSLRRQAQTGQRRATTAEEDGRRQARPGGIPGLADELEIQRHYERFREHFRCGLADVLTGFRAARKHNPKLTARQFLGT
jgi:hypothetical protein